MSEHLYELTFRAPDDEECRSSCHKISEISLKGEDIIVMIGILMDQLGRSDELLAQLVECLSSINWTGAEPWPGKNRAHKKLVWAARALQGGWWKFDEEMAKKAKASDGGQSDPFPPSPN